MTMASVTNFEQIPSGSDQANGYRQVLQRKIDEGARGALALIEQIHREQPQDALVPTHALEFESVSDVHKTTSVFMTGIRLLAGGNGQLDLAVGPHALGQLAERAGIPVSYLRELADPKTEGDWRRDLACEILTRHFRHATQERALVRSVRGVARGFLSDRYRRLDSRPLVEALTKVCQEFGAVPYAGVATETRVALKVILPQVIEVYPGEFMAFGGEWSNSDYGNGTHGFRAFMLRPVCLNGAVSENSLREVHLGGRLSNDVEYSERTRTLDTARSRSMLTDVVRGALSTRGIERMVGRIRQAREQKFDAAKLRRAASKMGKTTQDEIVKAYESNDVINLPPGDNSWRASNAVSWVARHCDDAEKRLDLERLAGSLA